MDSHLAPGLRVVPRGLHHLQVGLHAARRAVLPCSDRVEDVLARLLAREPVPQDPESALVLDRLRRTGCVREGPVVPRATGTTAVLGSLGGGAVGAAEVEGLLERAGLRLAGLPERADTVIVLHDGELPREHLDPLVRRQTSHVVVRQVDGGVLLGPFVVPGVTACLRCVDAHERLHDPDHAVMTARYAQATARPRPDGTPDVVDPLLAVLAVTWAVRDVVAHLGGRRPSTWSRTLWWDPEPADRQEQGWLRHPECGCSWSPGAHAWGTMGP